MLQILISSSVFLFSFSVFAQSSTTAVEQPVNSTVLTSTPPIFEKIKWEWSGDLRYRMAKKKQAEDEVRNYQQYRARLGVNAEVNEQVRGVVRLATGTSPLSTNQVAGDSADPGMPRRFFGVDQAYINWQFAEFGNVWAGRTANPFWSPGKSQTIFDSDLSFEGLAVKVNPKWGDFGAFLNIGGFIVYEGYAPPEDIVDIGIVGGDTGVSWKFGSLTWTTHLGNYYFLNIQDKEITNAFSGAKIDDYSYPFDRYNGNTVYVNDPLLPKPQRKYYFENKYVLIEAGTELKHKFEPFEATLFFNWVHNQEVSIYSVAKEYGLNIKWKWLTLGYALIDKDSDSVVAAFTDDDAGGGGTDYHSSRITAEAQITKNVSFDIADYQATRGVTTVQRKFAATYINAVVKF